MGDWIMADLTKSGVCYDLIESPFFADAMGFRFYFSSATHRENFMRKAHVRKEWLNDSLSRRFKYPVDASLLAVLQLYKQIETRGFFIVKENGQEYRSTDEMSVMVVDVVQDVLECL